METEKILFCGVIPNGYILKTSDVSDNEKISEHEYRVCYDGEGVDLFLSKSNSESIPLEISVVGGVISRIDQTDNTVTIVTDVGKLEFTYQDGNGYLKVNDEDVHMFKYLTPKELYFQVYAGPYYRVYVSNFDRPYKLNKIYPHLYYDGGIETINPLQLSYIVNEEHLKPSIQALDTTLGVMVDKQTPYSLE